MFVSLSCMLQQQARSITSLRSATPCAHGPPAAHLPKLAPLQYSLRPPAPDGQHAPPPSTAPTERPGACAQAPTTTISRPLDVQGPPPQPLSAQRLRARNHAAHLSIERVDHSLVLALQRHALELEAGRHGVLLHAELLRLQMHRLDHLKALRARGG